MPENFESGREQELQSFKEELEREVQRLGEWQAEVLASQLPPERARHFVHEVRNILTGYTWMLSLVDEKSFSEDRQMADTAKKSMTELEAKYNDELRQSKKEI